MLPAHARLRRRGEFSQTLRGGRRAARRALVVHFDVGEDAASPRVGFIVSKAVGNAVTRHQVTRRLRHLMPSRLAVAPAGSRLVIRALPAASRASSAQLGQQLDDALRQLLKPIGA